MSFAKNYAEDFQKSLKNATEAAETFFRRYMEEQGKIYSGEYGVPDNNAFDDKRFPLLHGSYELFGFNAESVIFASHYPNEESAFAYFPLLVVLTKECLIKFFEERRLSYGLGETPEQSAEIAQLKELQKKYPHVKPE